MAGQGKISVELRLVLDKLNADIRAAAQSMRAGLSKDMGSTAAGTEKAASAQAKLGNEVKKTTNALKDQAKAAYDAWKASLPTPRIIDATKTRKATRFFTPWTTDAGGGLATDPNVILNPQRPKAAPGTAPPAMFPIPKPPVIPPSQSPVGLLGKMIQGGLASPLAIAAQIGASLAGLRVAIGLVQYAFRNLMLPLQIMRRAFLEAAEGARRLYARSLQSGGLGTGFVARRALLAETIGVSEEEVFSYGRAVRYLNGQLAFATSVAAGTNASLTATAWSLRIVQTDLKALTSLVAYEVSDAIRLLARMFHQLATEIAPLAAVIGKMLRTQLLTAMTMAAMSLGPAMAAAFARIAAKAGFGDAAPTPEVSIKRMPFSAWEKMGLVVGTGGGNNYAQQTARNTRMTAEKMDKLIGLMTGGNNLTMGPIYNMP